jgi:hypothetical protein
MDIHSLIDRLWDEGLITSRSRWKSYRSSAKTYVEDVLGYSSVKDCEAGDYVLPPAKRHSLTEQKLAERSEHVRRNIKNETDFILKNAQELDIITIPKDDQEEDRLQRAFIIGNKAVIPTVASKGFNANGKEKYALPIERWPKTLLGEFLKWREWATRPKNKERPKGQHNNQSSVDQKRNLLECFFGYLRKVHGIKGLYFRMFIDDELLRGFSNWHSDVRHADRPGDHTTYTAWLTAKIAQSFAASYFKDNEAVIRIKELRNSLGNYVPVIDKDLRAAGIDIKLLLQAANAEYPRKGSFRPTARNGKRLANRAGRAVAMMLLATAPLRNQNFREARIGKHLIVLAKPVRHNDPKKCKLGQYALHFTGDDTDPAHLKIRFRDRKLNVYYMEVPGKVAAYIDTYLDYWHPLLSKDSSENHLFLNIHGKIYSQTAFSKWISFGFLKWTGRKINPHLCRDIVSTEIADETGNINAAAGIINDSPATFWARYNRQNMKKVERVRDAHLGKILDGGLQGPQ